MLEIIKIISTSSVKLKHNVIFLFNGAEENMLQVSYNQILRTGKTPSTWKPEKVLFESDLSLLAIFT